jgi:hypothetical protein
VIQEASENIPASSFSVSQWSENLGEDLIGLLKNRYDFLLTSIDTQGIKKPFFKGCKKKTV